MARTNVKIIGVAMSTEVHRRLWHATYSRLRACVPAIRSLCDEPDPILQGHIGVKSPYYTKLAITAAATHRIWRRRVHEMDTAGMLPSGTLTSMRVCRPAGVFQNIPADRTCRRHAVCPFCRYRYGLERFEKLSARLPEGRALASTSFEAVMDGGCIRQDDLSLLKAAIARVCRPAKHHWVGDLTCSLPTYVEGEWALRCTVIALGHGDMEHPQLGPDFGGGLEWEVGKPNVSTLARMVANAVAYPPEILMPWRLPAQELAWMTGLSTKIRRAGHGFR